MWRLPIPHGCIPKYARFIHDGKQGVINREQYNSSAHIHYSLMIFHEYILLIPPMIYCHSHGHSQKFDDKLICNIYLYLSYFPFWLLILCMPQNKTWEALKYLWQPRECLGSSCKIFNWHKCDGNTLGMLNLTFLLFIINYMLPMQVAKNQIITRI